MTQTMRPFLPPRTLDTIERLLLAGFFTWFCYRILSRLETNPYNIIALVSEAAVLAFILFRRPTEQISTKPTDWAIGFAGNLLPLLLMPTEEGLISGVALVLAGMILSIGAKFSLRRSFGIVAANRGIKRTGLYAAVRHPMYLGYFVTYLGMAMLNPSLFNVGLLSLWAVLQISRIHAEEKVLMQDPLYQEHAKAVRYRLLPLVY